MMNSKRTKAHVVLKTRGFETRKQDMRDKNNNNASFGDTSVIDVQSTSASAHAPKPASAHAPISAQLDAHAPTDAYAPTPMPAASAPASAQMPLNVPVPAAHAPASAPANVAPTNQNANKSKKSRIYRAAQIFFLLVFIVCLAILGFIAAQYIIQRMNNQDLADRVVLYDENVNGGDLAKMTIDWDALRAECPDVVAWITIPDSVVNYPVVQGSDNEYYLHRSYDGTTSWASTGGTIFLDSGNTSNFSDENNVFYGHHMYDGSMFAEIASWENQDNFDDHRIIYVLTPTMNYRLTTFANVITTGDDAIIQTKFSTAEDFTEYVSDKMERSVVSAPDFVRPWDNMIESVPLASRIGKMFMLVTCEYSRNDGRACACAYVSEQARPLNAK